MVTVTASIATLAVVAKSTKKVTDTFGTRYYRKQDQSFAVSNGNTNISA